MKLTPLALLLVPLALQGQPAGGIIPGQYIVQLRAGAAADPGDLAARHGVSASQVYRSAVRGFAGAIPPGILLQLESDSDVASIEADHVVTADAKPQPPPPPPPTEPPQVVPGGIARIGAAPGSLGFTGVGIGVAIVDTGIDFNHPDLVVQPQQFRSQKITGKQPTNVAQDDHGHGTHVSGIVAARDNAIDVVGVAPDVKLYAVKVLYPNPDGTASGSESGVIAGLNWVAQNAAALNIKVINMSLGRFGDPSTATTYHAAIQNLVSMGVTVVVAAMNDSTQEISNGIPAGFPEVIAVASTTAADGTDANLGDSVPQVLADTASSFTTDGAGVAISAPGEDHVDTNADGTIAEGGGRGIISLKLGGGVIAMRGTSMATPHVTGVVALQYQKYGPALTPSEAKLKIAAGADRANSAPLDNWWTAAYTFDGVREGILSAPGALYDASASAP